MQANTGSLEEPERSVQLVFRPLLAIDIEKYSRRTAREQLNAQTYLRRVLNQAIDSTGTARDLEFQQVSGDGELMVFSADVDVAAVVGGFAMALESSLAELNSGASPSSRLRVRLAAHYGTLIIDQKASFGPPGDAPIVVNRLLDSRPLRQYLTEHQDRDVALIVSESLYRDVICTELCLLKPNDFRSVRVHAKSSIYRGFVYNPELAVSREQDAHTQSVS